MTKKYERYYKVMDGGREYRASAKGGSQGLYFQISPKVTEAYAKSKGIELFHEKYGTNPKDIEVKLFRSGKGVFYREEYIKVSDKELSRTKRDLTSM